MSKKIGIGILFVFSIVCVWNGYGMSASDSSEASPTAKKLYWFIPDGMRAEPEVFTVFKWAREGKLPHIKKMMDEGTYGYCIPVFPSHTPVNFASLLTGAYPKTHGVADGPMHIKGRTLDKVAISGFSSVAKRVPPIWVTLEEHKKKVVLLSMPGSTPPELDEGITIRGRWGGWGADFHGLNFESQGDWAQRKKQGKASRLFFFGPQLTRYIQAVPAEGWETVPDSFSPVLETCLSGWGADIFACFYDSSDDGAVDYDRIILSLDKKKILADLQEGEWSDWQALTLKWKEERVPSDCKIKLVKLNIEELYNDGFFRIRILYNNLNSFITKPADVADEIINAVGPMVDFVDNFPPQLIYYPEDKETFLEEAQMSYVWHKNATQFILDTYRPDVYIHDIYSPNQMLTSRWWLGYVDPASKRYTDVTKDERKKLWDEVLAMYKKLDDIIGVYLEKADDETVVVLSSDHGAIPLNKWVRLNNYFAQKGLLRFGIDEETGEPHIDWKNTKVIYLKMDNIYIRPDGLAGEWTRGSGPEYEKLRNEVIQLLYALRDETGEQPVAVVTRYEDVENYWDLPEDRVGDLVIANEAGFGWNEEVTENMEIFSTPLKTGYKQAVLANETKGMWTPFIIMGPGVRKNHELKRPIRIVDQYPTIMQLMGIDIPAFVEGKRIDEVFDATK